MLSMARVVSLTVLTVLIVFLGIMFFRVVAPFLLPLFLAGVTAILCQPVFHYFIGRTGNRVRVAAGLTTATTLFIMLVPLLVATLMASLQFYTLTMDWLSDTNWHTAAENWEREFIAWVSPYLPGAAAAQEVERNIRILLKSLAERSLGLAGTTLNRTWGFLGMLLSLLVSLVMFVIALYYFLADGPALLKAAEGLIPVHIEYQRELRQRFEQVVRAVVIATFLAAIAQGLATSLALYIVGWHIESEFLRHFFIIGLVTTLAALVPVSGTWLVWGPCALWCFFHGYWPTGILLTLFGSVVVGTMDNVIRTYVLQSDARLHPLLAFISVLGGLQMMGLWGVFIGPIVASCLHALVKIFNTELKQFSNEKFSTVTQRVPKIEDKQDVIPIAPSTDASQPPPADKPVDATSD